MSTQHGSATRQQWQLLFPSLFNVGRAMAFPCDAAGNVALDALSERGRNNYLFVRTVVGRDFGHPRVVPQDTLVAESGGDSHQAA